MRHFPATALALILLGCATPPIPDTASCESMPALTDLIAARDAVRTHYVYTPAGGVTVDELYDELAERAAAAETRPQHLQVLERFVFGLADHHAHLSANSRSSPRLIPSGTSVWVEYRDGRFIATQVRPGSTAREAGLREGMEILSVNGAPMLELSLPPHSSANSTTARSFAARVALAGTYAEDAVITARGASGAWTARLAPAPAPANDDDRLATLSYPASDVALIRINNSLGNTELPQAFDTLMQRARSARAVILDLRDTPAGGDSVVGRPIMSWFFEGVRGYQRHRKHGREWLETVTGRPDAFRGRLVVLVDHWTGSMGEGVAIGLRSGAGAILIGTPMAGLRGAMESFPLPCLGVDIRLPAEQLFTVEGEPRERAMPDLLIDEDTLSAADTGDPILAAALQLAER